MSSEVMACMKIKSKVTNQECLEGFKAFVNLLKFSSFTIEDSRTGWTLAYLEEVNNEELFQNINHLKANDELTLKGYGDSWSFESAQTLLDLLIEHKESVINTIAYSKGDREKVEGLINTIEVKNTKLQFTNIIFKEDFDEFF